MGLTVSYGVELYRVDLASVGSKNASNEGVDDDVKIGARKVIIGQVGGSRSGSGTVVDSGDLPSYNGEDQEDDYVSNVQPKSPRVPYRNLFHSRSLSLDCTEKCHYLKFRGRENQGSENILAS